MNKSWNSSWMWCGSFLLFYLPSCACCCDCFAVKNRRRFSALRRSSPSLPSFGTHSPFTCRKKLKNSGFQRRNCRTIDVFFIEFLRCCGSVWLLLSLPYSCIIRIMSSTGMCENFPVGNWRNSWFWFSKKFTLCWSDDTTISFSCNCSCILRIWRAISSYGCCWCWWRCCDCCIWGGGGGKGGYKLLLSYSPLLLAAKGIVALLACELVGIEPIP